MASEGKPKSQPSNGNDLRARTLAICEAEFEERWGQPWLAPGEGSLAGYFVVLWEGEAGRNDSDRAARALYRRLRRAHNGGGIGTALLAEARAFVAAGHTEGVMGGAVSAVVDAAVRGLPPELPPPSWYDERYAELTAGGRSDDLPALVRALDTVSGSAVLREHGPEGVTDDGVISDRDAAVIALLSEAIDLWKGYERRGLTPAQAIEDVQTRVRSVRSRM